jgi:protein Mpv17
VPVCGISLHHPRADRSDSELFVERPFTSAFSTHHQYNAPAITTTNICAMAVLVVKTAGRAVLRRSHFSNLQPNIAKRHSTNNAARDDPAKGTAIPVPNTVANVPLWQRLGPLSRGFQAYGRSQRQRPYTTQFCSSLVIYFLGDLSAQSINGDEYDPKRTLRALIISAGSSIPSYKW